jgi:hypothetical protein
MQHAAVRIVRADRICACSHGCIIGAGSTRRIGEITSRSYRDCSGRRPVPVVSGFPGFGPCIEREYLWCRPRVSSRGWWQPHGVAVTPAPT